jgi:hypothetical protein
MRLPEAIRAAVTVLLSAAGDLSRAVLDAASLVKARRYIELALIDRELLEAHVEHLRSAGAHGSLSTALAPDRVEAVLANGIVALSDAEVATLLVNPIGLCALADAVLDAEPLPASFEKAIDRVVESKIAEHDIPVPDFEALVEHFRATGEVVLKTKTRAESPAFVLVGDSVAESPANLLAALARALRGSVASVVSLGEAASRELRSTVRKLSSHWQRGGDIDPKVAAAFAAGLHRSEFAARGVVVEEPEESAPPADVEGWNGPTVDALWHPPDSAAADSEKPAAARPRRVRLALIERFRVERPPARAERGESAPIRGDARLGGTVGTNDESLVGFGAYALLDGFIPSAGGRPVLTTRFRKASDAEREHESGAVRFAARFDAPCPGAQEGRVPGSALSFGVFPLGEG